MNTNAHVRPLHFLRPLAFALFGVIALLPTAPLAAQGSNPFMKYPNYGAAKGQNSVFDHEYPNYTANGSTMLNTGVRTSTSYDGHSGIDYNLVYEPVLAAASGTLDHAGWFSTNHESSYGLSIRIVHSNGYKSLYGHMSAILYMNGNAITQSAQLGTGGTTGNSTGPHLHFEPQVNVSGTYRVVDVFGWTGSGSIPTDPWRTSTGAISKTLYTATPTTTTPSNLGETIVDNTSAGFTRSCLAGSGASCPFWFLSSTSGYGGSMYWTYSNGATADYRARWTPTLASGGYEVQVHIANSNATSHATRYTIVATGSSRTVVVDQHDTFGPGAGRWVSLGTYGMVSGTPNYVEVSDATFVGGYTESGTSFQVGVDAVKFIRH